MKILTAVLLAAFTPTAGLAQSPVAFVAADGGTVAADAYGEGRHGVVLVHGGRFDKASWKSQAQAIAQAGYRVLAIDLRGYGTSMPGSAGEAYQLDVLAAVRYLLGFGADRVTVIGASMGGGAAAQAAVDARPGEIDGLVLLAHSSIAEPERMQGRKLFIVSRDDVMGEATLRLPMIREQFERASEPKQLVVLDGSAHAQFIFDTDQGARLMQEILRFLALQ